MNPIIQINNLNKSFGQVHALKSISLEVNESELFGIIGPDGAGKTTLFRTLATLYTPDSGNVSVLGYDVVRDYKKIRPLLGYMPGRFSLYQDLTVEENIRFFASVFGTTLEENYKLVEPVYRQIEPFKNRLAGDLSGGMKQKLALSCALIHKPRLLILDEPTTGVDAVSRVEFWDMLAILVKDVTIIVATPYMDEARRCNRVAFIQEGEILQVDTPEAIVKSFKKPLFGVSHKNRFKLIRALKNYPYSESVHTFGDSIHYTDQRDLPDLDGLKTYLHDMGLENVEIGTLIPGIEDSFMALVLKEANHA
ncbi:MAG: ABC transporter ATP-binding protein [Balneolaceae bacterium]|nr:MAG: ABC transporter ATP-binding protein [Balneolaceae bacterium]